MILIIDTTEGEISQDYVVAHLYTWSLFLPENI